MRLHLAPEFDRTLAPVPATKLRDWWEDNPRTTNHAKHCLPLQMANSLGWYILSPGTFIVTWDGDVHSPAQIQHIEKSTHYEVDAHAAYGSFTVQPKFIPVTEKEGDFVFIKGIPNERCCPYSCMEAVIEAWWSVGRFGLVFLLNQPGEFMVTKGHPIAQMFVLSGGSAVPDMEIKSGYPAGYEDWHERRYRKEYHKDLDYFAGKTPGGEKMETHITNWEQAAKFR
jgi:hypothetical protein